MLVQKALDNTEKDFGLDSVMAKGDDKVVFQPSVETLNMPYLTNAKKHVNLD